MTSALDVRVSASKEALGAAVGEFVLDRARLALATRGQFSVALSGGSMPGLLASSSVLVDGVTKEDAARWHVFFVDERVLCEPADSNELGARAALLNRLGVPDEHIYGAPDATAAPTADEAAKIYQQRLEGANLPKSGSPALPQVDLVLLGLGEDGHTASLFPGHALLHETERLIAPITDSPKPPPNRITFTLPLINNAAALAFVAAGAGKKDVIPQLVAQSAECAKTSKVSDSSTLPSARVQPSNTNVPFILFTDSAAAENLQ